MYILEGPKEHLKPVGIETHCLPIDFFYTLIEISNRGCCQGASKQKALFEARKSTVEIYQLKVFLEVARYLSFTEAAATLNLTQPAVSAKIKSLEASLGTELFHRSGRKIKLTVVGDYLFKMGPGLLELESRLVQEIEEIKQGKYSHLRIGCTVSVANGWLPKILFEYRQKYPEVDVQCLPFSSVRQLHKAMSLEEIDIGFSESTLQDFEEIKSVPIDSFRYCLMVAADHRLAKAEWLSLRNLTAEAWVFPAKATPERVTLDARLNELGLTLSDFQNHEIVNSSSLMSPFLTQGHYLGFASSLQFITERKANVLRAIPLQEFSLDLKLFMLQPVRGGSKETNNSQSRTTQPTNRLLKKPVQQLIRLVEKKRENRVDKNTTGGKRKGCDSTDNGSTTASPRPLPSVYLQSLERARRQLTKPEKQTIAIGTQNKTIQTVTAGIIIQQLGLLEHFLPQEGRYSNTEYQIQWRDFTSGAPIVAGLHSAQLDIGILGDYPLLLSGAAPTLATDPSVCEHDADALATMLKSQSESRTTAPEKTRLVSFVASNPDGAGNTVIVPNRSPLTSLDDLRHRVIAVPFASAAHGMIMRSLTRADLLPEVTLTSIDNLNIHRLTPRNNQADGYAYFAPLHDIASHKGKFRRLLGSDMQQQLPTFHGIVVRESFADEHPDLVIAYLKALIAAQYWYETTPNALSLVSQWVELDAEIVAKTLADYSSDAAGLFFPDTKIRTDWVEEHIRQLSAIAGNEALGDINLSTWIQPQLLKAALASI